MMDGRMMLLVSVALMCATWFFGGADILSHPDRQATHVAPDPVETAHAAMRQRLSAAGRDLQKPSSYVVEVDGQTLVTGPITATEHLAPVFIGDAVAGYVRPAARDLPGEVSFVQRVRDCRPATPQAGSRIVNIFANATPVAVSLFGWTAGGLDGISSGDMVGDPGKALLRSMRYSQMDVAIAEMDVPVHLVLQSGRGQVLWNLHPVVRARITGVTLLGGALPAIANLPKDVPVEVMDAEAMEACGLVPARLPTASDPIFGDMLAGHVPPADARAELVVLRDKVEAWNRWFAEQFGLRSDETRIGYDKGALMALVGAVPSSPLLRPIYKGLDGAPIAVSPGAELLAATPEQAVTTLAIRQMAREEAEQTALLTTDDGGAVSAQGGAQ